MIDSGFQYTNSLKEAVVSIISEEKRTSVINMLSKYDFDVHQFNTVPDRLAVWGITPEVILLDGSGSNPWEAYLVALQKIEDYKNIPVVIIMDREINKEDVFSIGEKGIFSFVYYKDTVSMHQIIITAITNWRKLKEILTKNNHLNRTLSTNYLVLDSKNNYMETIKKRIDDVSVHQNPKFKKQLITLSNDITENLKKEFHYQLFKAHFEEIHPLFYKKLLLANKDLSNNDLKLAAFIKMGFNNSEISFFLGISMAGVKKAIQRMKIKLKLSPEESLRQFVFAIEV